jgi:drug/metabolite transporter (DMT)-like permease
MLAGAELGVYTTLGFAFQSIGLETTTASRSAFLLYLNVKFVPFLALLLLGRSISKNTWTSAFLALMGKRSLLYGGIVLLCVVLYCALLPCAVLQYTVLHHTINCTVLLRTFYFTVVLTGLFCSVLYWIILYHTILYCTVLYSTIFQGNEHFQLLPTLYLPSQGTALLSTDGGPLNSGDVWCISAAIASAMFILRLDKFSKENDPAELSGVSFSTVSALCGAWVGVDYMRERGVVGEMASSMTASWSDFIQVREG